MSIADRAVQAYQARLEAEAAARAAEKARERAQVIEAIGRKADVLGIGFDADALIKNGSRWELSIPV
ncbi:MAG TPA: hypothetical protein VLA89_02905, partial [Gemmatimonadales bacterium]|nr:hypothetical protein [Gemmatimonadales bacterium]